MKVATGKKASQTLHVVDSCGWLAFFGGEPNAAFFEVALVDPECLIVPALTLYEVGKRILQDRGEPAALEALVVMQKGRVVQLDPAGLYAAAKTALQFQLSMGDAIIWQTAHLHQALLYTQDAGLSQMPGVMFKAK